MLPPCAPAAPRRRAPDLLWRTDHLERPGGAGAVRKRLLQRTSCRNHLAHHGQFLWRHYRQPTADTSPCCSSTTRPFPAAPARRSATARSPGCSRLFRRRATTAPPSRDAQIQSELLAQITAGHLPAPVLDAAGNPNTLYMIFFPPGKTITQGGSNSCQAGGFCAYHGTTSTLLNGKNVLYGVMPDMQARPLLHRWMRQRRGVRQLHLGDQPRTG